MSPVSSVVNENNLGMIWKVFVGRNSNKPQLGWLPSKDGHLKGLDVSFPPC